MKFIINKIQIRFTNVRSLNNYEIVEQLPYKLFLEEFDLEHH